MQIKKDIVFIGEIILTKAKITRYDLPSKEYIKMVKENIKIAEKDMELFAKKYR